MSPEERSTRRDVLALLAVLSVTTETLAQDAIAADPRSFRVLIDNERVRVLEYRSGPGLGVCGQGMHDHPDRVTVALTPAKVRVVNAQGQTLVRDIPPGHVLFEGSPDRGCALPPRIAILPAARRQRLRRRVGCECGSSPRPSPIRRQP